MLLKVIKVLWMQHTTTYIAGGNMKKTCLWVLCFAAAFGIAMPSQAFEAGVRGDYWFPELSGDLSVDAKGITGTSLDLETDLGLDDESYPVVEAFVGLGNHHLRGCYYNADYSGTKILTEGITFNGETFAADERITSSLEYDVYDFMYQYDLLDLENVLAGFTLGIVGRVEVFDGDVEIKSEALDKIQRESFTATVPMVGLNLHVGILADWLEARVLATGIGYSDGTMFDGQAEVSFTPFPFLDIHGGYRFLSVDVDVDDVAFNYDNAGPYVALTVGF
jgi:outer membrane protein